MSQALNMKQHPNSSEGDSSPDVPSSNPVTLNATNLNTHETISRYQASQAADTGGNTDAALSPTNAVSPSKQELPTLPVTASQESPEEKPNTMSLKELLCNRYTPVVLLLTVAAFLLSRFEGELSWVESGSIAGATFLGSPFLLWHVFNLYSCLSNCCCPSQEPSQTPATNEASVPTNIVVAVASGSSPAHAGAAREVRVDMNALSDATDTFAAEAATAATSSAAAPLLNQQQQLQP
jgi:hypothetical protein